MAQHQRKIGTVAVLSRGRQVEAMDRVEVRQRPNRAGRRVDLYERLADNLAARIAEKTDQAILVEPPAELPAKRDIHADWDLVEDCLTEQGREMMEEYRDRGLPPPRWLRQAAGLT